MKHHLSIALAAALAMSGASGAFAGNMSNTNASNSGMNNSMSRSEHATTGKAMPTGKLTLSNAQKKQLWSAIDTSATPQTAPSGFSAKVGQTVPSGVQTQPLPEQATNDVPVVKNYNYAMLQNRIVLVNPRTNKVAGVIDQQK